MALQGEAVQMDILNGMIEQLAQLAENQNESGIKHTLKEIVTDYHPGDE